MAIRTAPMTRGDHLAIWRGQAPAGAGASPPPSPKQNLARLSRRSSGPQQRSLHMACYQIPDVHTTTIVDCAAADPGAIERVLSANELAIIATCHPDACACWACVTRAVAAASAWYLAWRARRGAAA
jgi:hypothetical protein